MPLGFHIRRKRESLTPSKSSLAVPQASSQAASNASLRQHAKVPGSIFPEALSQNTVSRPLETFEDEQRSSRKTHATPHESDTRPPDESKAKSEPRDLWDAAYAALRADNPKLIKQHETVLLLANEEEDGVDPGSLGKLLCPAYISLFLSHTRVLGII